MFKTLLFCLMLTAWGVNAYSSGQDVLQEIPYGVVVHVTVDDIQLLKADHQGGKRDLLAECQVVEVKKGSLEDEDTILIRLKKELFSSRPDVLQRGREYLVFLNQLPQSEAPAASEGRAVYQLQKSFPRVPEDYVQRATGLATTINAINAERNSPKASSPEDQ